jgi:chromate transporter
MATFGIVAASTDLSDAGWVHGLKLAAVAVVALALWMMARTLAPDWPRRVLAVVAAAVALAWPTPFAQVVIIAAGALVGWLILAAPAAVAASVPARQVSHRTGLIALSIFVVLLVGLSLLAGSGDQPIALFAAFYRAGALVFGGGHVVLPLLDATVVAPGWVTESQFLAGYGAAQAVPGPLFSFAAYLGAVSTPSPNGWAGAALALIAIYVPSFLLVLGAMPSWERIRTFVPVRRALAGTGAAVVGLLAAALYDPVWTGAVMRPIDAVVAGLGFGLLMTGRVPPIVVVAPAAVAGQLIA